MLRGLSTHEGANPGAGKISRLRLGEGRGMEKNERGGDKDSLIGAACRGFWVVSVGLDWNQSAF